VRTFALKKILELHIAPDAWSEVLAVCLAQRVHACTSILATNLPVNVTAAIVKS
jgi:hypothetical protein